MELNLGSLMANVGATVENAQGAASVKTQPTFNGGVTASKAVEAVAEKAKSVATSVFTSPIFLSIVGLMVGGVIALIIWQMMNMTTQIKTLSEKNEAQAKEAARRDQAMQILWSRTQAQKRPQQPPPAKPEPEPADPLEAEMARKAEALARRAEEGRAAPPRPAVAERQVPEVSAPSKRRRRRFAKPAEAPVKEEPPQAPAPEAAAETPAEAPETAVAETPRRSVRRSRRAKKAVENSTAE